MTAEERQIRLRIAQEIIGDVVVDFLEENRGTPYTNYGISQEVGVFDDDTFGFFLRELLSEGRVVNPKPGRYNRWQAKPLRTEGLN